MELSAIQYQVLQSFQLKRKVITLFIYLIGLVIGYCLGGVPFLQGAIFVGATVAITAIGGSSKFK